MSNITVKEMIKVAKANLVELSVEDVKNVLDSDNHIIIDLRDTAELIENGIIPGSHHSSRGHLEFLLTQNANITKISLIKIKILFYIVIQAQGLLSPQRH